MDGYDVVEEAGLVAGPVWREADRWEQRAGVTARELAAAASLRWMVLHGRIGGAEDGVRDGMVAENGR
jgi:hypothetical protein